MIATGTYQPGLVLLSILIAVMASFTALSLAGRVRASTDRAQQVWLATAAVALGGGVWAMHFVAMLAFALPGMTMTYDVALTLMSLAIIAGSLGILTAHLKYGIKWDQRFAFAPVRNLFLRFTDNKWGFDDVIDHLIVAPTLAVSRWGLWKAVDQYAIDGIVNGLPRLYREVAEGVRGLQTGAVRLYAYAMFLGTLAVLAAVVARFGLLRF